MGMSDLYIHHEEHCDDCISRNEKVDELEEQNKTHHLDNSPVCECKECTERKKIMFALQKENFECANRSLEGGPEPDDNYT